MDKAGTDSSDPDALVFSGTSAVAALAVHLGDRAPTAISDWLATDATPSAIPNGLAETIAEAGALLSEATEGLLIRRFDPAIEVHHFTTILHDRRTAVFADGGSPDPIVISRPEGLDVTLARLAEDIGGSLASAPSRPVRLPQAGVVALRGVLGHEPCPLSEALERLGPVLEGLRSSVGPEEALQALEEDGFVMTRNGTVEAGPVCAEELPVSAAANGSTLEVTRMSLSREPECPIYDVRTLEFAGPPGSRCLVLPRDGSGDIGFVRLSIGEVVPLLASHAVGRAEPARAATEHGDRPSHDLALPRSDATLSSRVLSAPETDFERALSAALLMPEGVVTLRHVGWDGGRAEGVSVSGEHIVGWSWSNGAGHILVKPRTDLSGFVCKMLAGHLADVTIGSVVVSGSRRHEDGLEYASAEIRRDDRGDWTVTTAEGLPEETPADAESLAEAVLTGANLA